MGNEGSKPGGSLGLKGPRIPSFRRGKPDSAKQAEAASGGHTAGFDKAVDSPDGDGSIGGFVGLDAAAADLSPELLSLARGGGPVSDSEASVTGGEPVDIAPSLMMPRVETGGAQTPIGKDDFLLLKVIGKGSFGKVFLVQKKGGPDDGVIYAMKSLRKEVLLRRNQIEHTKTERAILEGVNHPFIVGLRYAFQTQEKLYLVTDFASGGELFFWLKRERAFSQARVRIYAAELVLALEHLHAMDVVYRDMKPENILLDGEGHIKLTDFGLSKMQVTGFGPEGGTKTFCGTPEYLAPEVLEDTGHGKAVDWWSLGTLLYEMMAGLPPFYDTNVEVMYEKILTAELRFPRHFLPETRSLLTGMLTRQVDRRLGYRGAAEIKAHPFFHGLDWEAITQRRVPAPFVPPRNGIDGAEPGALLSPAMSASSMDGADTPQGGCASPALGALGAGGGASWSALQLGPAASASGPMGGTGSGAGASGAGGCLPGGGGATLGGVVTVAGGGAGAKGAVVSNFEEEFTRETPVDSVVDRSKLSSTAIEKTHFEGFTYMGEASALGRDFDDEGGEDGHDHSGGAGHGGGGEACSPGNEYQNAALYASPPSSARNSGTAPGGASRGGPRSGSAGSCGPEHDDGGVAGSPGLHPSGVGLAAAVASDSAARRSAGR